VDVVPVRIDVRLHHTQTQYVAAVVFNALHDGFLLRHDWCVTCFVEVQVNKIKEVFALVFEQCSLGKRGVQYGPSSHWIRRSCRVVQVASGKVGAVGGQFLRSGSPPRISYWVYSARIMHGHCASWAKLVVVEKPILEVVSHGGW